VTWSWKITPRGYEAPGIDYEVVKEINPRVIMCGISGFGSGGPIR